MSLSIPGPDLAVIHNGNHILFFQLPDFSVLSPGEPIVKESPTWSTFGPLHGVPTNIANWLFSEPIYDSSCHDGFNLYLMHSAPRGGRKIIVTAVTPPVALPSPLGSTPRRHTASDLPPLETQMRSQVLPSVLPNVSERWSFNGESFQDVFYHKVQKTERGFEYYVRSYEVLLGEDGKGTLRMLAAGEGMGSHRWYTADMSIDEASGRVLLCVVGDVASSRFYIGDLV